MNHAARRTLSLHAALFAIALCAAGAARAQNWGPAPESNHQGLYFAGGIGGGLQLVDGGSDGALGGQIDLRIGYSFARRFQIYLEGDLSGGSHSSLQALNADGSTSTAMIYASDVMVGLRYFLFANRNLGVYARAGLGLGIVGDNSYGDTTQYGVAETYALGMEFRLGGPWSLTPELYYRRTNETQDSRVDSLGLGILINFN